MTDEFTNESFQIMRDEMQKHFEDEMFGKKLFKVDVDVDELWHKYLDAYPEEMQSIYRENRWQDCSACRKWFRKMANVVAIDDNLELITMFSYHTFAPQYQGILNYLRDELVDKEICEVFLSSKKEIGIETSYEEEDGEVERHDHFYSVLPNSVIREGVKVGQDKSKYATNRQTLERTLHTITIEALDTVLDLIADNNLYRGQEWEFQLKKVRELKLQEPNISDKDKNNWYWLKSMEAGSVISNIKSKSIGTLLVDLSNDEDIEIALKKYEAVVAPENYQRPKAIFTKKMLEEAKNTITELGYLDSLARRYAEMEDISINDVLFANRNINGRLQDSNDLFGELEKDAIVRPKKFNHVEAIGMGQFIDEVLPKAESVSLYTDMSLINNFMSLIAPVDHNAPTMFKWDNAFSWAYRNNVADSMKQQVKDMGGDVDVDLRFSIRWNNMEEWDKNDLDAHCTEPNGNEIYYSNKNSRYTDGWLDVDIIDPQKGVPAVENIRFKDRNKMIEGEYLFRVHQFNYCGGNDGFEAEIEFDGQIYHYSYPIQLKQGEYVDVAKVIVDKNGNFELINLLDNQVNNRINWNVKMNEFIPVQLVCYSPNYWGNNEQGNKHIFFILEDCINDSRPNAWYNEYLKSELIVDHKKVMEALGQKAKVVESDNQLSGIGFSLTKPQQLQVKVLIDNTEKIYNIII